MYDEEHQQHAVRILAWMVHEVVGEIQAALGPTGLGPNGDGQSGIDFQQAMDAAFLRAENNPFRSREELSAAHFAATETAAAKMHARIAALHAREK